MGGPKVGWKSAESRPIAGPRSTGSWPHVGRASTQGLLQVNRGTAQRRLKVGRLPNIFPPIGHNYSCHIYSRIYMYMQEVRLMIMSLFTHGSFSTHVHHNYYINLSTHGERPEHDKMFGADCVSSRALFCLPFNNSACQVFCARILLM